MPSPPPHFAIVFETPLISLIEPFRCAFGCAVSVSVGLLCLGLGLIGQNPNGPLTTIDFTSTNLAGAFFMFGIPLLHSIIHTNNPLTTSASSIISCSFGAKLMSTSIILAAHIKSRKRALCALCSCGCCCAGLYAYGWGGLLLGSLPCYFGDSAAPQGFVSGGSATGGMIGCQGITSFSVFFGIMCVPSVYCVCFILNQFPFICSYTLIFLPMAIVCACTAYYVACKFSPSCLPHRLLHRNSTSTAPMHGAVSELHASQSRSLLIGIVSLGFFLLCMSCTTFLTWQFAVYAANGYQLPGTGWPVNTNYTNNYFQGNYDPLNFALFKWNSTGPIIVQLWPDVIIFTAFMLVLFLCGFATRLYPSVSAVFNKQLRIYKDTSISLGFLLLLLWTVTLIGTWAYYWSFLYCDRACMSDSGKSRFQCCRMFQETRKCTLVMDDPAYGCGTKEQQANAGNFVFLRAPHNFVVILSFSSQPFTALLLLIF